MIPIARPVMTSQEKEKVLEVMESGMLAAGSYVEEFARKFADYSGTAFGVATSSGTTALHAALEAAGIGAGDKVITTPFTFIASSNSILYTGAKPVFVDVDPLTYNIDPKEIRKALEADPTIKAIMIVHLYGLLCDMEEIMRIVDEYDLILIEDAAQSHGAEFKGQRAGSFGQLAAFSFYPTKNMTTGEGGIILTQQEELADRAARLINHGQSERYYHDELGYNYRMTNLAAAIGLAQLERLDDYNAKRRANAKFFDEAFAELDWLRTPLEPTGYRHVYHQYTVKVPRRDQFAAHLKENGIGYGIHYPLPVTEQPFYKELGYGKVDFPVTQKLCREVVSLPVHPALTEMELTTIAEVVKSF